MMEPFKEILTFFLCHLMGNTYLCGIEQEAEKVPLKTK